MSMVHKLWLALALITGLWFFVGGPMGIRLGVELTAKRKVRFHRLLGIHFVFSISGLLFLVATVLGWAAGGAVLGWSAFFLGGLVQLGIAAVLIERWAGVHRRNGMRAALVFFLWIAVISAIVIAFLSRDSSLEPQAEQWLTVTPDASPRDNLYYALIGFGQARAGEDPFVKGLDNIMSHNRPGDKQSQRKTEEEKPQQPFRIAGFETVDALLGRQFQHIDCDDAALSTVGVVWQEQFDLVSQYERLYEYPQLRTTAIPGPLAPLPSLMFLNQMGRLTAAKVVVDVCQGEQAQGIGRLKRNIAFSRFVLGTADQLLLKAAAAGQLMRSLYLYSALLSHPAVGSAIGQGLDDEIAGLNEDELDLTSSLINEFRTTAALLIDFDGIKQELGGSLGEDLPTPLYYLFWKPHHATNHLYKNYLREIETVKLPPEAYLNSEPDKTPHPPSFIDLVRNPFAIAISQMARPSFYGIKLRIHDLDGLTRLVRIRQKMVLEKISMAEIKSVVQRLPDALQNPYTQAAMEVDLASREIYFQSPHQGGRRKIAVGF